MSIKVQVHWLSITIWKKMGNGLNLWNEYFEKYLGPLVPTGHREPSIGSSLH